MAEDAKSRTPFALATEFGREEVVSLFPKETYDWYQQLEKDRANRPVFINLPKSLKKKKQTRPF
jgi:hypothetical protein